MGFCIARFDYNGQSQEPRNVKRVLVQDFTFFLCLFEKNNKTANVWKSYVLNKSFYDKKNTINIVGIVCRSVGNGIGDECQECRWSGDLV